MHSLLVIALTALPQPAMSPVSPRGSVIASTPTANPTSTANASASPSPPQGERVGVRGPDRDERAPHPNPLPASGEREERVAADFTRASGSSGTLSGIALPAAALSALAAAGLLLARRRSRGTRLVQVVETAGLGAKRSLVVARMGPELLLLGVSEAGVALLATRPAPEQPQVPSDSAGARPEPRELTSGTRSDPEAPPAGRILSLISRWRAKPPAAGAPSFDACLVESTEDQELRRKLARGLAGSVR